MPDGRVVHPGRRLSARGRRARPLTPGEAALVADVFGEAIEAARVRIVDGGVRGFALTLGSRIWFPRGSPADFADAPPHTRAWFVHEMTHVWQFQTAPLATLRSWAATALGGGYGPGLSGYRYALPVRFGMLALERQAKVVEHAYLLREGHQPVDLPAGAELTDYAGATPFAGLSDPLRARTPPPPPSVVPLPRCAGEDLSEFDPPP